MTRKERRAYNAKWMRENRARLNTPYRRAYKARWNREHRHEIRASVRSYKERMRTLLRWLKDQPCMDCTHSYPQCAMDFDHRPGEKKLFTLSQGVNRSLRQLAEELAKCDVVCANCHRIRTAARSRRRAQSPQHSPRQGVFTSSVSPGRGPER